jgi:hypothetical protein
MKMKFFTALTTQKASCVLVMLLGIALLASCKKDDPYDFENVTAAQLNFINASPDAGSANIFVENIQRTQAAVGFGGASGYNKTFPGPGTLEVRSSAGDAVLISTQAQFDVLTNYTFMLVGQGGSVGLLTLVDDQTAPSSGKAKIRFVNASPNAPGANLLVNAVAQFSARDFRSVSGYSEIAAGTYPVVVSSGASSSASASLTFQSGKIYTLYAKGLVGGTGANALGVGVFANN